MTMRWSILAGILFHVLSRVRVLGPYRREETKSRSFGDKQFHFPTSKPGSLSSAAVGQREDRFVHKPMEEFVEAGRMDDEW